SGYGSSFSSGTLRVGRSGFPIRPDLWYNVSRPRERNEIMTKEEALKTYFGYDDFRGGQESIIDALLAGRDALASMPTGAGKSLCYQIPALLLPGITLVISPLVSLMRDQVTQLVQMGVPAAYLNSSLTFQQCLLALSRAKE